MVYVYSIITVALQLKNRNQPKRDAWKRVVAGGEDAPIRTRFGDAKLEETTRSDFQDLAGKKSATVV